MKKFIFLLVLGLSINWTALAQTPTLSGTEKAEVQLPPQILAAKVMWK